MLQQMLHGKLLYVTSARNGVMQTVYLFAHGRYYWCLCCWMWLKIMWSFSTKCHFPMDHRKLVLQIQELNLDVSSCCRPIVSTKHFKTIAVSLVKNSVRISNFIIHQSFMHLKCINLTYKFSSLVTHKLI